MLSKDLRNFMHEHLLEVGAILQEMWRSPASPEAFIAQNCQIKGEVLVMVQRADYQQSSYVPIEKGDILRIHQLLREGHAIYEARSTNGDILTEGTPAWHISKRVTVEKMQLRGNEIVAVINKDASTEEEIPIQMLSPLKKFLTHDGYEVFEGDEVFLVYCSDTSGALNMLKEHRLGSRGIVNYPERTKMFKKKKAAEAYQIHHTKMLSIQDIIDLNMGHWDNSTTLISKLTSIVKQKFGYEKDEEIPVDSAARELPVTGV